jgi:hypothetical protein
VVQELGARAKPKSTAIIMQKVCTGFVRAIAAASASLSTTPPASVTRARSHSGEISSKIGLSTSNKNIIATVLKQTLSTSPRLSSTRKGTSSSSAGMPRAVEQRERDAPAEAQLVARPPRGHRDQLDAIELGVDREGDHEGGEGQRHPVERPSQRCCPLSGGSCASGRRRRSPA